MPPIKYFPYPDKIFFCSDLHLSHKNIIVYSSRPFDNIDHMNEMLIKNWNETVPTDGIVFFLGDFCFGSSQKDFISKFWPRLNGHIYFLFGNHDKAIKKHFREDPPPNVTFLGDYYEFRPDFEAEMIVLSHYMIVNFNKAQHGAYMLFGHSHGSMNDFIEKNMNDARVLDVGVDSLAKTFAKKESRNVETKDYRPISYVELVEYMKPKAGFKVDHH
jgi:calcineurin-like phosphoesterase family protein